MTVAMIADVLGGRKALRVRVETEPDLRELTRKGLPVEVVASIAREMRLSVQDVSRVAGISARTLSRRMTDKSRLTLYESDRLVRLADVFAYAKDVLESSDSASRWLQIPNRALGGDVPLDLMDTSTGAAQVREILGRIDYGLFS